MATSKTAVAKAKAKGSSLPANLKQEVAQDIEDLRARLQAPSGDKIKVDNKQFKLPNGDTSDLLSCILVDFVYYNVYYSGAFDPNNITPPDCFAISPAPTGMTPSANSPDIQGEACQACWANQFGTSGKGKACRNTVVAAVLPPDATEETPLMIIQVSPTALKSFAGYVSAIARAGMPPYGVITEISCDPNVKYDSLRFGNPQPVDQDTLLMVRGRREEARQRLLVEPDVSAMKAANDSKPVKAPAGKGKLQAPKKRA